MAGSMADLMAEAPGEQALRSSTVGLQSGPLESAPLTSGAPAVPPETLALREHIAELDSELQQRDAVVDRLKVTVSELRRTLDKAMLEPQNGSLWRDMYEEAQLASEARERALQELQLENETRVKEIALLSQYIRKLEDEANNCDGHRERLLLFAVVAAAKSNSIEAEQKQLLARLHGFEDSFARCIGRVTQALAAGVMNVSLDTMQAVPRFAVFRLCPGGSAVLEVCEQPDSSWELAAVDLSPTGDSSKRPALVADKGSLSLMLSGVVSGNAGAAHGAVPTLRCADKDDFAKWAGALGLLRLLPEGKISPTSIREAKPERPNSLPEGSPPP
ncbi:unnamed protein product [Polarella glacialis]|uniref:Uncharacterized protein n=1 Tax=Polarella glacialis TaxID=89957 RepID=A0A813JL14_POLGL|nr:unnamed protein product [Polarella glacialis]